MYKTKTNEEIGKYLSNLIDQKFSSKRQFCIALLKADGISVPDDVEIGRMSNRISQITNGKKSVQLTDFPLFSMLLEVSCEEILSAGECRMPTANHLTNYSAAYSDDKAVWEEYVHREDKLILNLDEYGKTVIDYALEFKNLAFLKYLMKNKYIWFVDVVEEPEHWYDNAVKFGIGTSFERRERRKEDLIRWRVSGPDKDCSMRVIRQEPDGLEYELAGNDDLRMQMISLAIEHNEIEMLHQLRAREIPSLYEASYISYRTADCDVYYNEGMIQCIAKAGEEVLDYFSEEFEIKDRCDRNGKVNVFLFPFMHNLIDLLIKEDSQYVEKMLRVSIEHNRKAYDKLKELERNLKEDYKKYYESLLIYRDRAGVIHREKGYENIESYADTMAKGIMDDGVFWDNGSIIIYRDGGSGLGLLTNLVHVDEKSDKTEINSMIQEVNDWYDKIRTKQL